MTHLSSDCHGPVIFEAYTFLSGACAVCACGTHSTRASPPHVVSAKPDAPPQPERCQARYDVLVPGWGEGKPKTECWLGNADVL